MQTTLHPISATKWRVFRSRTNQNREIRVQLAKIHLTVAKLSKFSPTEFQVAFFGKDSPVIKKIKSQHPSFQLSQYHSVSYLFIVLPNVENRLCLFKAEKQNSHHVICEILPWYFPYLFLFLFTSKLFFFLFFYRSFWCSAGQLTHQTSPSFLGSKHIRV